MSTATATLDRTAPAQPSTPSVWEPTAKDRCDSCGAQAYVKLHKNTQKLFLCAHHGNKNISIATQQGFSITDHRSLLK